MSEESLCWKIQVKVKITMNVEEVYSVWPLLTHADREESDF